MLGNADKWKWRCPPTGKCHRKVDNAYKIESNKIWHIRTFTHKSVAFEWLFLSEDWSAIFVAWSDDEKMRILQRTVHFEQIASASIHWAIIGVSMFFCSISPQDGASGRPYWCHLAETYQISFSSNFAHNFVCKTLHIMSFEPDFWIDRLYFQSQSCAKTVSSYSEHYAFHKWRAFVRKR